MRHPRGGGGDLDYLRKEGGLEIHCRFLGGRNIINFLTFTFFSGNGSSFSSMAAKKRESDREVSFLGGEGMRTFYRRGREKGQIY